MAAEKARVDTKLQVVMTTGETEAGKASTKTFTFSRIKGDASDDELLAAGKALGSLCANDLDGVKVTEVYALTEGL